MEKIFKDVDPAWKLRWDYLGWKNHQTYDNATQNDWNQTLITRINEITNQISMSTLKGKANKILLNSKCAAVLKTLEFYNDEKKKLGAADVEIDNSIKDNWVYIYRNKNNEGLDEEKIQLSIGAIYIDNLQSKTALITGITGQDGSYLAELLLSKGYVVHGVIRRASTFNTERIDHLMGLDNFVLHHGDITDSSNVGRLIAEIQPDEIYNLAAQSHVKVSFEIPHYTAQVDALGTLTILEAMRTHCPNAKFYQASTSELYGGVEENKNEHGVYDEDSPFYPRSPYGVAKLYGFWIIKNYREAYNLFACNGILFNHESERRGKTFVTRKITTNMVQIKNGTREVLTIGNLDAKRDWGHAEEYVEGMWRMLQQDRPDDFVLATGKTYKVRTFIEMTAKYLGWEIEWKGKGIDEKGYDKSTGRLLVEVDPKYFRPTEVDLLIGDPSKAKKELGWEAKIDLEGLVERMVKYDLEHE